MNEQRQHSKAQEYLLSTEQLESVVCAFTLAAAGVMWCLMTTIARSIPAVCIRSTYLEDGQNVKMAPLKATYLGYPCSYILMGLTPTDFSSVKKTIT
jgi:hypothetical protein